MQFRTRGTEIVVALALICAATLVKLACPAFAEDEDCRLPVVPVRSYSAVSRPQHVFVIVVENESYKATFGTDSQAPYLSKCLTKNGQLLANYYGIGHYSLDNYIAMVSGQSPNPDTQQDCPVFSEFASIKPDLDDYGQAVGHGCVYPADVSTIANQLEEKHLTWRGYMEDMQGACQHPKYGGMDPFQRAKDCFQYATKHNPFVYFHSIDEKDCRANDVPLNQLKTDLAKLKTTPNLSFIVPNLCNDGHDHKNGTCVDGKTPGGLVAIDAFLRREVPMIMNSKAYQRDGMLIITFDEADIDGPDADASSTPSELVGPNTQSPGLFGPGGGQIGAVIISPFVKSRVVNPNYYNHYSLLRSLENLFGLPHLGYADKPDPGEFGTDVYNQ